MARESRFSHAVFQHTPSKNAMNLILTGFMASGKTTIGRLLSPMVDLGFVDADDYFEEQMGIGPGPYIRRFSEETFRKHESRLLREILNQPPIVLATGGGVVLKPLNRSLLQQNSFVVWLEVPLPILLLRLQETFDRPLIADPPTFSQTKTLLETREPFYRQSHFKISNTYRSPNSIANEIARQYKEFCHAPRASQ